MRHSSTRIADADAEDLLTNLGERLAEQHKTEIFAALEKTLSSKFNIDKSLDLIVDAMWNVLRDDVEAETEDFATEREILARERERARRDNMKRTSRQWQRGLTAAQRKSLAAAGGRGKKKNRKNKLPVLSGGQFESNRRRH